MIDPEHVSEIVVKLREWGVNISHEMHRDIRDEFDVRDDIDKNKPGKFSKKSEVSRLAALRATPRTGTQRRSVYDYICWCNRHDVKCTRDSISTNLGISPNSVRPRIKELIEGGWVSVRGTVKNQNGETVETLMPTRERT